MPAVTPVEERLAAVETAVADLQRRMASPPPAESWVERFTGSFKDEPAFAQVIEYGRTFRGADQSHENHGP